MKNALDKKKLRQRMQLLELKQWWLADTIGVDRATVRRWCNGQILIPHEGNIVELARALGVTERDILTK